MKPIKRADFAIWCGVTGMRSKIQDAADDKANPLRAIALTLIDFLRGGVSEVLEMDRPENQAMLAAWQQAGLITQDQTDQLLAMTADDPAPVIPPAPTTHKVSAPGTPSSWHVQPAGNEFQLFWDSAAAPIGLFPVAKAAEDWMMQWYSDHPPIEVQDEKA